MIPAGRGYRGRSEKNKEGISSPEYQGRGRAFCKPLKNRTKGRAHRLWAYSALVGRAVAKGGYKMIWLAALCIVVPFFLS